MRCLNSWTKYNGIMNIKFTCNKHLHFCCHHGIKLNTLCQLFIGTPYCGTGDGSASPFRPAIRFLAANSAIAFRACTVALPI